MTQCKCLFTLVCVIYPFSYRFVLYKGIMKQYCKYFEVPEKFLSSSMALLKTMTMVSMKLRRK